MSTPPARVRPRVRARGAFILAAAAALAAPAPAAAQAADSVVWVWLDHAAFPDQAEPALGPRALSRRARQGVPTFATDAPVPETLVAALESAGLRVRFRSRWLRAVSGEASGETLERIRELDFVTRVTRVAALAMPRPVDGPRAAPPAGLAPPPEFYGVAFDQVAQIGVPLAHDLGYTGAGIVVALLDTGFDQSHESLAPLTVIGAHDFIGDDSVVANEPGDPSSQENHGTEVWSAFGGFAPDEFVGPAYGADFLLAKVDRVDAEPPADEDRWVAALEWADSMGAQLVSSSLGYTTFDDGSGWTDDDFDGDTAPSTIAADAAAARGILIVNAAGNEGAGDLIAPADADSVIAVGAVDAAGFLAGFSSTGPTADGRIKPELVARGVLTALASPSSPTVYTAANGTSFATPLVAGGAALVMEAWPELGAMDVRDALLLSGSNSTPNDSTGYGLPDIGSAILFPRGIRPLPVGGTGPGGVLATLSPAFNWSVPLLHPAAAPVRYLVQIAADSLFTVILREDTAVDVQTLTLDRPLEAGEGLWWRVVAETSGVVRQSSALGPFTVEPWVRLVTLNEPGGVFIVDRTPLLVWDPLTAFPPIGPLLYDVQVFSAETEEVVAGATGIADTSFTVPQELPFNVPFRWRVVVHTASGEVDTAESVAPFVVVSSDVPPVTLLYQNFPNPFPRVGVPNTTIWFDLSEAATVSLGVYDIRGRLVRRLIPDVRQGCTASVRLDSGTYGRDGDPPCVSTSWDGLTDDGERMPPGVYIIRLMAGGDSHTVRTLYRP